MGMGDFVIYLSPSQLKHTLAFSLCVCVCEHVCVGNHKRVKWCKIMCLAYWHIVMYVNAVWLKTKSQQRGLLRGKLLSSPLLSSFVSRSKQVKCLKRCIEVSLRALYDGYVM